MNIAGVLIHARPDKAEALAAKLATLPGVEVHRRGGDGRLVITVEEVDETSTGERLLEIQCLDGLLSASLVYHHFEPDMDDSLTAEAAAERIEEGRHAAVTA